MPRFLLTIALVVPLLDPGAVLARIVASGEPECRDHACMCVRRCPARRTAEVPCHGERTGPGMRSACHHDEPSAPRSVEPLVLPPGPCPISVVPVGFEPSLNAGLLPPGFGRLDLPPPRTL